MLAGNDELRVGQRGLWRRAGIAIPRTRCPKPLQRGALTRAMLPQQLLGSFLKLFQRRMRWQT
jgi:hypothetical protein